MATKTFISGGVDSNWSTAGNWSPSGVPANGDDVVFNASSPNCTLNVDTSDLHSLDMTGYANTLTASTLHSLNVVPTTGTVSCILEGTINGYMQILLGPSSGATINLYSNGTLGGGVDFFLQNGGTVSLQTDLDLTNCKGLRFYSITFNTNGHTITLGESSEFTSSVGFTLNLNITNSTIISNLSATSTCWDLSQGTVNLTSTGSTIILENTNAWVKEFYGGGKTYNILTVTGDYYRIRNSNTFNTLNVNNGGKTHGLILVAGRTQTVTNLNTNGSSGNLAILKSSSTTAATYLTTTSSQISVDYMNLTWVQPLEANVWYAGTHSTDGGNNGNWIFTDPPVVSGPILKFWNGSSWISGKPVKVWNGSTWAQKTLKQYNGSTWVTVT